ncbi:MAG TPA: YfaZ family outer membrane protein [Burkholderiales bacterium]|nr:YfaZ family outer membrane protein [Burkholderiales bacterium]
MWRRTLAVFLAFAGAGTAAADTLDVNVNNHVVEGRYGMPVGTGQVGVGGLHHDVTNDWLIHAGFLGRGEARTSMGRSEIGLGGRAYGGSFGPNDVLALALGADFLLYPSNQSVGVGAYLYYAPSVLSSRDTERFLDAGVRVEFEVIKPTGVLYVGFRQIRATFKDGDKVKIDDHLHLGLRINF